MTSKQTGRRPKVATDLLSCFGEDGNEFLSRNVAINDTWMTSLEPEFKSQAAEWDTHDSPRPANVRRILAKFKMLMTFAYDTH